MSSSHPSEKQQQEDAVVSNSNNRVPPTASSSSPSTTTPFSNNNQQQQQRDDEEEKKMIAITRKINSEVKLRNLIQKHNSELHRTSSRLRKRKIIPSGSVLSALFYPQDSHVQTVEQATKNTPSRKTSMLSKRGGGATTASGLKRRDGQQQPQLNQGVDEQHADSGATISNNEPVVPEPTTSPNNNNLEVSEFCIDDLETPDEQEEVSELRTNINLIRAKIVFAIHSQRVQTALLLLLLLDVFVIIAELIIGSHQTCHLEIEPEKCYFDPSHAHGITNSSGFFPPFTCGVFGTAGLSHGLHTAEEVLAWVSRVILFIFTTEIILLLVCLGLHFFTILYTIDAIIVISSLVFSFTLDVQEERESALIIFLRLWRFARVLHGFGMTVHEVDHSSSSGGSSDEDDGEGSSSEVELIENEEYNINDDVMASKMAACKKELLQIQYKDDKNVLTTSPAVPTKSSKKEKREKSEVSPSSPPIYAPQLHKKQRDELLTHCKELEVECRTLRETVRQLEKQLQEK